MTFIPLFHLNSSIKSYFQLDVDCNYNDYDKIQLPNGGGVYGITDF